MGLAKRNNTRQSEWPMLSRMSRFIMMLLPWLSSPTPTVRVWSVLRLHLHLQTRVTGWSVLTYNSAVGVRSASGVDLFFSFFSSLFWHDPTFSMFLVSETRVARLYSGTDLSALHQSSLIELISILHLSSGSSITFISPPILPSSDLALYTRFGDAFDII